MIKIGSKSNNGNSILSLHNSCSVRVLSLLGVHFYIQVVPVEIFDSLMFSILGKPKIFQHFIPMPVVYSVLQDQNLTYPKIDNKIFTR
jgi:hypothetical protein